MNMPRYVTKRATFGLYGTTFGFGPRQHHG